MFNTRADVDETRRSTYRIALEAADIFVPIAFSIFCCGALVIINSNHISGAFDERCAIGMGVAGVNFRELCYGTVTLPVTSCRDDVAEFFALKRNVIESIATHSSKFMTDVGATVTVIGVGNLI